MAVAIGEANERDEQLMAQAAQLAEHVRRRTPPNPWVGALVVADGTIVGRGATEPPGQRHAEIVALHEAGDSARSATLYTTLEPCSHHGRTGPCVDAILDAGIARVVVAVEDPDLLVAGTGIARLRAGGVTVDVGVDAAAVRRRLAPYLHHRRTGRAFCLAKTATSVDGRTAAADGSSQWITGPAARADAHGLRADSQAVVVGAGTALADRPALTVRDVDPPVEHAPLRVLLDARGRVPATGSLFEADLAPTLVITTDAAPPAAVDDWRAAGAKVETVPGAPGGVDLSAALHLLGGHGVLQATVEGGPTVHGALLAAGLVDHLVVYVGAALLGPSGAPAFAGPSPATIAHARRLTLHQVTALGDDVRLDYTPVPAAEDGAVMFTGIVEELGRVRAVTHADGGARVEITCHDVLGDAAIGDSIAVNGCCLTVVELGERWWAADAQVETLDRTTLGALAPGDPVNLERPLRLGDRLGGHLVLGHVDGVGDVVKVEPQADGSTHVTVRAPAELARYLVEKGSVTVDGVSLTITTVSDAEFGVALIPHTLAVTTLGVRSAGDRVNLEADMIAKHVERLLITREA